MDPGEEVEMVMDSIEAVITNNVKWSRIEEAGDLGA